MKKITILATLLLSTFFSISSHAGVIGTKTYVSDPTKNYWTNLDLSLDILRLSWTDTLGDIPAQPNEELSLAQSLVAVQKNIQDMIDFVNANENGWRFATILEFDAYNEWFDTDPDNVGWSSSQKIGSDLFFELNGLGPAYSGPNEQNGYAGGTTELGDRGYTYWQFGTLNEDLKYESVWFAMFADAFPESEDAAQCAIFDNNLVGENCSKGYLDVEAEFPKFTVADPLARFYDDRVDENGEYVYPQELHFFPLNTSMLLVRDVSEAPVIILFMASLGIMFGRIIKK